MDVDVMNGKLNESVFVCVEKLQKDGSQEVERNGNILCKKKRRCLKKAEMEAIKDKLNF